MDFLLSKITAGAVNYAIRSGLSIGGGYAISQCSRYIKTVKSDERDELARLQHKLDSKIRVIAPAIDMIELIAARGNTSLESAVTLTKTIRWHIQELGRKLAQTAADEESSKRGSTRAKSREQSTLELKLIVKDIKGLIERIDDAVPLINLAITTSGVSLSTNLPPSISPSRLLQASTFLSHGDSSYLQDSSQPMQIGPRFTVSMYMLFLGHASKAVDEEGLRTTIWKEVIHKAQVKLVRVPLDRTDQFPFYKNVSRGRSSDQDDATPNSSSSHQIPAENLGHEFAYQLSVIEDLEDDRVHTFEDEETPGALDDVEMAGIRTFVPIHEVAKIFYADTGKILNMGTDGENNNPVLLLKRDLNAPAPRRMMDRDDAYMEDESLESGAGSNGQTVFNAADSSDQPANTWKLPADLDPEWIAFEVYTEEPDTDSEGETDPEETVDASSSRPSSSHGQSTVDASFLSALSRLRIGRSTVSTPTSEQRRELGMTRSARQTLPIAATANVTTSLSLMEMLIRLTSLQQFQQCSHLTINDELLNFFLEESSTTGAASGDAEARKRIRMEARQHVGFDPYDESPIKRRGEAYQTHREDPNDDDEGPWSEAQVPMSSPPLVAPRFSTSTRQSTPQRSSTLSRSTPPLPREISGRKYASPITPPGTVNSRQDFFKAEAGKPNGASPGRGSPLAKGVSISPEKVEQGTP